MRVLEKRLDGGLQPAHLAYMELVMSVWSIQKASRYTVCAGFAPEKNFSQSDWEQCFPAEMTAFQYWSPVNPIWNSPAGTYINFIPSVVEIWGGTVITARNRGVARCEIGLRCKKGVGAAGSQ